MPSSDSGWRRQAIYNAVRQAVLHGMSRQEIEEVVARARLDAAHTVLKGTPALPGTEASE